MSLNIVLDKDIILSLLSLSKNDIQHSFARLQKSPIRFWIPMCLLSTLQTQIFSNQHRPLSDLLTHAQLLSSLAIHWRQIPSKHPNQLQALISLDATLLPGHTIIWTNDENFQVADAEIEFGDHEFVYAMLAEYEQDSKPFIDLETQQLALRPELEKSIFQVFKHGKYILGPEVKQLESQLANYVGCRHCITTANSVDAILLCLLALEIQPGDEIITSVYGPIAAAQMIRLLGAKPVFVDIHPDTYNLDSSLLDKAITAKTKAIMPIDLYGQCADYDAINRFAGQHHLPIIENIGTSFGAVYREARAGHLTTLSCVSFVPSSPLGTYSDVGACFTNNEEIGQKLRQLRFHGQVASYEYQYLGLNSRLDSLQAGFLLSRFAVFPKELQQRSRTAHYYRQALQYLNVKLPTVARENVSIFSHYTIEVNNREALREQLQAQGISTGIHYAKPLHLQPVFADLNYQMGDFPVAEQAATRILNLPMHAYLTEGTLAEIVDKLKKVLAYLNQ